jgi:hypothetical protein
MNELTSEELLQRVTQEMIDLRTSGAGMRLEIAPEAAFAVVAMCQLGLRHPDATTGAAAEMVREFIDLVELKFARGSAPHVAEAIRRGNNTAEDIPRAPGPEIPPAAFGRLERPNFEELRFFRLIEERIPDPNDGSELIVLACRHQSLYPIPPPVSQEYAYCPQCVNEYLEASRARTM